MPAKMSLNISLASLRSAISLSEKRDALLDGLAKVELELSGLFGGAAASVGLAVETRGPEKGAGRKPGPKAKVSKVKGKVRRGGVKDLVLGALAKAGEAGIGVRDLAANLGVKPASLHVWFATTGKSSGLTERVGSGVYRLKAGASEASVPSAAEPAKAKRGRKPGKGRKAKTVK